VRTPPAAFSQTFTRRRGRRRLIYRRSGEEFILATSFRSFATEQKGYCDAAFIARPLGTGLQPEPQLLGRMFQLGANAFFESNEWN